MDLIDKGTHMEDAAGNKFAKHSSSEPPHRRKRKKLIKPADGDILFGLWLQKAQKLVTLTEISDATGWKPQTLIGYAKRHDFDGKVARILKTQVAKGGLSVEKVAGNLAGRLIAGAEEHQMSVDDIMGKARQHFKKMKGATILKNAKDIDTLDKVGRRLYKLDSDDTKPGNAGATMNIAVLLGDGVRVVTAEPAK